jgi:two-component system sensor histidine kinase KdpD
MAAERPSPDELLRQVAEQGVRAKRGALTIFFGAAAGVGKTYTMLEVARAELEREKRDVVIGIVETHGRYDTGALVLGIPLLPKRKFNHRAIPMEEFDLDAALARRPQLILVDELAHTNAPGSRHAKRWQDVEELCDAGIDVFTTVNVQHVESLNDVIAKITGVVVRETVPDSVFEEATDIKLVDLPPDDLLERLHEGKVYVPPQAQHAIENFFKKGNLIALRELALRRTAERVEAQMLAYRRAQGIEQTWAVAEYLLVAVSPSPHSARLVRAARRMAAALHARWFAVYVESTAARSLSKAAQTRLSSNLRLAEQLGAQVVTLAGEQPADVLLEFARQRNITKIIVGKPLVLSLRDRFRSSLVDEIVRQSGDIDVYVTAGDPDVAEKAAEKTVRSHPNEAGYAAAAAVTAAATVIGWALFGGDQLPDVVMTYLLGIVLVSIRFGLGPSVLSTLLGIAAFDFFFVPPTLTFAVREFKHVTTFAVMLVVAVVVSTLTERVKKQAAAARKRELTTAALYDLSRELAGALDIEGVITVAARHLERVFTSQVAVWAPDASGQLVRIHASPALDEPPDRSASISQWVWLNRREAGLGTRTLPGSAALYVPLVASGTTMGVLSLKPEQDDRFDTVEQRRQVDTFGAQLALAMERARLSEETQKVRQEVQAEQLRSSLLSSVSHDLRTPLAVITGTATTLQESAGSIDEAERRELLGAIIEEAERLNHLIGNLLDMTRLESGAVQVKKEWLPLEEIVGTALSRLERPLAGRDIRVELSPGLPLVPCDPVLIELVLVNLLENAAKYSDGSIEIAAEVQLDDAVVRVADRGPGIPAGQEQRVFEKFHRAVREGAPGGVGLGLAICRGVVMAHGGRIWAVNREGGGAMVCFTLPVSGEPPQVAAMDPVATTPTEQPA